MSASSWKKALIPAVAVLLMTVFASPPAHAVAYPGPDSYGYFAQSIPWNLREPGDILISDDDHYTSTPLPFTFRFYGTDYSTLYVSTNGFVAFSDPGDSACCNGMPLPGSGYGNLVAPYWTDLVADVHTKTTGVPGSQEFIVSWVGRYYGSYTYVLAQMVLHENTHTIEFQYGDAPSDLSHDVTVGIENASETDALQIDHGLVSYHNQAFLISPPPLVQMLYVNTDAYENFVSMFLVAADGTLTDVGDYPTGGGGGGGGYYAAERIGLAVAGNYLFAANSGSGTITSFAINPTNGALTPVGVPETIGATGTWSTALAATPDGNYLIATSEAHGFITVLSIDPLTGALTLLPASQTPVPAPDSIRVSPDGNFVAVSDGNTGIHVFSFAGGTLTPVAGSPFSAPWAASGLAFNVQGTLLFNATGNFTGTNVAVFGFDATTGQLAPVAGSPFEFPGVGENSNVVLLGPDAHYLYVSNQWSNSITTLNVAGDGTLSYQSGPAPTGCCEPTGLARNTAGTLLFSANFFGSVSSYSVASDGSLTGVSTLPVSAGSISLAYWSSGAIVPPVMLDAIDDQSVVWGDELALTANATGGSGSYTYSLAPGAPAGAAIDGTTGDFTWTPTSGQLAGSPYTITVQVDDGSETDTEDFVVTVKKRLAGFTFPSTNPTAVPVTAPGGTSAAFTMCASFTDVSDGTGDLALATPVTFTFAPLTSGSPVTLTATITGSGSSRDACVSTSGLPVDAYDVTVNMRGDYYVGNRSTVIAVYDPSLGFTTGGGTVIHNGYVANFAFNVKYLKKNIQGGAMYIEHRPDGDWKVKSNSLQSLSIVGSTATIVTKATVNDTGNNLMIVRATDNGEPGPGVDLYGLEVRNSSGKPIASLTFDPMTIAGGNIQVPHTTGKK